MKTKMKTKRMVVFLLLVCSIILLLVIYNQSRATINSLGFRITSKDVSTIHKDIERYYNAINSRNINKMTKYTYEIESAERMQYLQHDLDKDYMIELEKLEVIYDYPADVFNNEEYISRYNITKAAIVKVNMKIVSTDDIGLFGLNPGKHTLFLYVATSNKSNDWQIIDSSFINPYR